MAHNQATTSRAAPCKYGRVSSSDPHFHPLAEECCQAPRVLAAQPCTFGGFGCTTTSTSTPHFHPLADACRQAKGKRVDFTCHLVYRRLPGSRVIADIRTKGGLGSSYTHCVWLWFRTQLASVEIDCTGEVESLRGVFDLLRSSASHTIFLAYGIGNLSHETFQMSLVRIVLAYPRRLLSGSPDRLKALRSTDSKQFNSQQ
ncbi:hypothetical protein BaRGS_00022962, partial [Batillaria attramentaria]